FPPKHEVGCIISRVKKAALILSVLVLTWWPGVSAAQSGRAKNYSESRAVTERPGASAKTGTPQRSDDQKPAGNVEKPELDVIKIDTELVLVPFRVTDKKGRSIADVTRNEVRIFQNGEEREIAYFSDLD